MKEFPWSLPEEEIKNSLAEGMSMHEAPTTTTIDKLVTNMNTAAHDLRIEEHI